MLLCLIFKWSNIAIETTGYAGYIPGIRSENMFGKTYGKITFMSVTN